MSTRAVRLARAALIVLFLGVGLSVVWMLRGRSAGRSGAEPEASPTPARVQARMQDLVHRAFVKGQEDFELQAQSWQERDEGRFQLEVVRLGFPYVSEGETLHAEITADECLYVPALQQAYFKGDVRLRTEDGFELDTDALTWRGGEGRAQTGRPVSFRRGPLSGTSTGMSYASSETRLVLPQDVVLRIERPGQLPIDVKSASAVADERIGELVFTGAVQLTQGGDELLAEQLTLWGWRGGVDRARAVENVELSLTPVAGGAAAGPLVSRGGPRHLSAQQLDLDFDAEQTLRQATANGPAELVLLPGPGEPPERRSIRAQVLIFLFDELGRLSEVQTQRRQLEATRVRIESLADPSLPPRTLDCFGLVARFDPETGELQQAVFLREVEFRHGARRATGQRADYDGSADVLTLSEQPRLEDAEQRSRLEARQIDVHPTTSDAAARHDVLHTLERGLRRAGGGVVGGEGEPVVFTARSFSWDPATRTASYRGRGGERPALLRSGSDEIRAPVIRVHEDPAGQSSLEAEGGVTSLLHTRPKQPGGEVTAIDVRSASMRYDEAAEQLVYRGGVELKQGAILTRSPVATLHLVPGGGRIQTLVAGEPVEIVEGDRRVNGERAVYDPETETVVVEGERVVFRDPARQIEGRRLEFKVADEMLEVGGQQQARTQTVFLGPQRQP